MAAGRMASLFLICAFNSCRCSARTRPINRMVVVFPSEDFSILSVIFAVDKQTPNGCNDRSTCIRLTHGVLDTPTWAGFSAFAENSACCCLDMAQREIAVRRARLKTTRP